MSLAASLARRNLSAPLINYRDNLSLESAAIEAYNDASQNIEELLSDAEEIREYAGEMHGHAKLSDNIDAVISQSIAAYGSAGMDEQGAELMRLSVESILRAADLPLHISAVVPSFESGMSRTDYSTEAEEKKSNLIVRLLQWLRDAFNNLVKRAQGFLARLRAGTAKTEHYIQQVGERAKKIDDTAKPSKETTKVPKGGEFLLDMHDNVLEPSASIKYGMKLWTTFIAGANSEGGELIKIPLLSASASGLEATNWLKKIDEAVGNRIANGLLLLDNAKFLGMHAFKVSHTAPIGQVLHDGGKSRPLIGATAKVEKRKAGKTISEASTCTGHEIKETVRVGLNAVDAVKGVENHFDGWTKHAAKLANQFDTLTKHFEKGKIAGMSDEERGNMAGVMKSLSAMTTIFGQAYSETAPLVMTHVIDCVRFADHCITLLVKGELATVHGDVKHDKPGHPRLTHDPAGDHYEQIDNVKGHYR